MSWAERHPKFLVYSLALTMLMGSGFYFFLQGMRQAECAELGGSIYHPITAPELRDSIKGTPPISTSCISGDGDVLLIFPRPQPN